MSQDSDYRPAPFIYKSRGLTARPITDQAPEYTYLDLLNCLERDENSMSSRFGTTIINRDPAGTGTNNYYFNSPVTSLSRLNYQSNAWRYAGLADGSLWRRAGNLQGPYSPLALPLTAQGNQITLSGQPFTSLVDSCFETSQPFNFIYDQNASIKDQGTGIPQLTGIDPSPYTLNVNPYAPLLIMIDNFDRGNSYTVAGVSAWGWGNIETLNAATGQLITDFSQFSGITLAGGGSSRYNPLSTSTSVYATQVNDGTSSSTSSTLGGFSSVVPTTGETISIYVTWDGSVSGDNSSFYGEIDLQYSPDGGMTWTTTASLAAGFTETFPSQQIIAFVVSSNLNLVQVRLVVTATVSGAASCSVVGDITDLYATVNNPGAFGPLVNGMLSLQTYSITTVARSGGIVTVTTAIPSGLTTGDPVTIQGVTDSSFNGTFTLTGGSGTTFTYAQAGADATSASGYVALAASSANIPIATVSSTSLAAGIYTQLLVTTTAAHGLTAGMLIAIYASSSDLVDGFYEIVAAPTTTTFTVSFFSAAIVGATGGYVTGGSLTPSACVLTDQYTNPYPSQITAWGFYEWVPPTETSFPVSAWVGTVAASSIGTVTKTVALDLDQNNQATDDDLIVLTLLTSNPNNIQQIQLQFFAGAGTNNYYVKFISPAYYQSAISQSQLAYSATEQQILADTLGLITGQPPNTTSSQLQPSTFSTGSGSWQTCYLRRGDFLPVGQAGQAGVDWANITGWQLSVTTNANTGGASFSVNGLYFQWGYGPSSFGGIGYDYRQTYYNANTGTESNGTPIATFNKDYGYLSSTAAPIFLRQAAQLVGQYSNDPQVTHVRAYRRGGTLASNWVQVIQAPNVTGGGQFFLKDVIADAFVQQAQGLVLDNDPPVTSSLVNPIQTTLAISTIQSGFSSIYTTFSPQTVTVAQSGAVFVPNQLVVIGNANSEEQVAVITGGVGTFTAIIRLQHNVGEPVNVYAVPRQACDLCAIAYDQVWLAGDKNNPHYLYYSQKGRPESFGPQNYIPVSTPDDAINAVIDWRGTLIVGTLKTWKIIVGGASPYAQPTGSVHGIVARGGWCEVEGSVWYRAADGLRQFTGADGVYKTLPVEWIYLNNPLCIPPQADKTQASQDVMAYYNNQVIESYVSLNAGLRYRMVYDTNYQRFRYDDVPATAMLWENDINTLLVGKQIALGKYAIVQDQINDYDDGGWSSTSVSPAPLTCTSATWTTPANATSTSLYASILDHTTPNALSCATGAMAIPLTATILGVGISFSAHSGGGTIGPGVSCVMQFTAGTSAPQTTSTLSSFVQSYTLGGNTFLWGEPLTPAIINAGFTAILSAGFSSNLFLVTNLNKAVITVYYSTTSPITLIQTPINIAIQTPYNDLSKPHNTKQFNELECDANTKGQVMTTNLLLDDGHINLPLTDITTVHRQKTELFVNAGLGQEAYRASIRHTMAVTVAPILYQEDIYAAVLAENSASVDSYWIKFGTDIDKFVKQGWFDYTSTVPIYVSLYADNSATPYFTFTLLAQAVRDVVRVRFGNLNNGTTAFTLRTWRIVMKTATDSDDQKFQMWEKPRIEWKPVDAGSGYKVKELEV